MYLLFNVLMKGIEQPSGQKKTGHLDSIQVAGFNEVFYYLIDECLSGIPNIVSQYFVKVTTYWESLLFFSCNSQLLHSGFQGGGLQPQQLRSPVLSTDPPTRLIQDIHDMPPLTLLQCHDS